MRRMISTGVQPQHQAFNRAQRAERATRAGNDGMKELEDAYTNKKSAGMKDKVPDAKKTK
jgi:hypothetical protein